MAQCQGSGSAALCGMHPAQQRHQVVVHERGSLTVQPGGSRPTTIATAAGQQLLQQCGLVSGKDPSNEFGEVGARKI